jgi:two-component system nitrogen regulation response regulator GlnG
MTSTKADPSRKKDDEDSGDILSLEEMERRHILHALSVCKNNKTEVCKKLGISRATLWRKLKELQIPVED